MRVCGTKRADPDHTPCGMPRFWSAGTATSINFGLGKSSSLINLINASFARCAWRAFYSFSQPIVDTDWPLQSCPGQTRVAAGNVDSLPLTLS